MIFCEQLLSYSADEDIYLHLLNPQLISKFIKKFQSYLEVPWVFMI